LYGNKDYAYCDVNHAGWEKFTNVFEEPDIIGSLRVQIPIILLLVCNHFPSSAYYSILKMEAAYSSKRLVNS
jgi:hypothetical protein